MHDSAKRIVLCNGCPCLNSDFAVGWNCNLGYDAASVIIDDNFLVLANDCGLIEIRIEGSEHPIKPAIWSPGGESGHEV